MVRRDAGLHTHTHTPHVHRIASSSHSLAPPSPVSCCLSTHGYGRGLLCLHYIVQPISGVSHSIQRICSTHLGWHLHPRVLRYPRGVSKTLVACAVCVEGMCTRRQNSSSHACRSSKAGDVADGVWHMCVACMCRTRACAACACCVLVNLMCLTRSLLLLFQGVRLTHARPHAYARTHASLCTPS